MTSERALLTALRQRSPIAGLASEHSETTGIAIGQTMPNDYADQIGSTPGPQPGLDLAAVVHGGPVADAERVGDLGEAAALRQQTEDFEIA
jgi:hypothetical protein